VVADGSPKPDDDLTDYTPSAFPGRRAPHAWLADGRSILDLFGHGFVLLNFSKADIAPLVDAARRRGVPLAVHAIEDEKAAGLYERKLVLVRPDGHVAWRGDECPADCDLVVATVSGHGPPIGACRASDTTLQFPRVPNR
jgi:hypothetical protein